MRIKITELSQNDKPLPKLKYEYTTDSHYQLQISNTKKSWTAKLTLKPLPKPLKKQFEGELFADYVDEPQAFTAKLNGEHVGWIELQIPLFSDRAGSLLHQEANKERVFNEN